MDGNELHQMLAWAEAHDLKFALLSELTHPLNEIALGPHPLYLQEEYAKFPPAFGRFLDLASAVNELFKRQRLPILFIKSFLSFPYIDTNLDVVAVKQNDHRVYRRHLVEARFRRLRDLSDLREPEKEFYARKASGDYAPLLHLHSMISWNGIPYLNVQQVYSRRRYWDYRGATLPIPCPEDELLIAAGHAVFENKYVLLRDVFYLAHLVSSHDMDWEYIEKVALTFNWKTGLCVYLKRINQIAMHIPLKPTPDLPPWGAGGPDNLPLADSQLVAPLPILWPFRITFRPAMEKLLLDLKACKISRIPRQLFSYLFVDYFWTYCRHVRRQRLYFQG
ncbi:hypothetical protein MYX82_00115 [Acidobacteria bacterium AH-259-D05]|nr:hypothetical protein [Acidobacteria bacterium AH-259-D05]